MNEQTKITALQQAIDEHMRAYRGLKRYNDDVRAEKELRLADGFAKRLAFITSFHKHCRM